MNAAPVAKVVTLTTVTDAILASGSADGTLGLWDLRTSEEISCLELGAGVISLATLRGGRLVAGVASRHPSERMHWLDVVSDTL